MKNEWSSLDWFPITSAWRAVCCLGLVHSRLRQVRQFRTIPNWNIWILKSEKWMLNLCSAGWTGLTPLKLLLCQGLRPILTTGARYDYVTNFSHCVPVTFLRSRGKFMSGDTFQGGAFFSSEGRFFFFRGALFFLQRGSFWSVEYAEKKSGGHRPPWKKKCDQKPPLKISSQWFLLICHTSLCLHRSLFSLNSI